MKRVFGWGFVGMLGVVILFADSDSVTTGPAADRVGFPEGYQKTFIVLRTVNRADKGQVVTIYGNAQAASVQRTNDLPYPNGAVIVMETAGAQKGPDSKPLLDENGHLRKDKVAGLHVMRRGKGFGEAYGKNRSGDWEFVEYRADKSYITPPQRSFACASCHIKAGAGKDFVYAARFGAATK